MINSRTSKARFSASDHERTWLNDEPETLAFTLIPEANALAAGSSITLLALDTETANEAVDGERRNDIEFSLLGEAYPELAMLAKRLSPPVD